MQEIILLRYHSPENISAILSQPENDRKSHLRVLLSYMRKSFGFPCLSRIPGWTRKGKDEVVTFMRLLNYHGKQMETVCNRTGSFTQQSALLQHFIWLWHHWTRLELLSESTLVVKLKGWEPRSRETGECGIQRWIINIYIVTWVSGMKSRKGKKLGRRKTNNIEYLNIWFHIYYKRVYFLLFKFSCLLSNETSLIQSDFWIGSAIGIFSPRLIDFGVP